MSVKLYATVLVLTRNSTGTRIKVWSPITVKDWADEVYVNDWAAFWYPDFKLDKILTVDPNKRTV